MKKKILLACAMVSLHSPFVYADQTVTTDVVHNPSLGNVTRYVARYVTPSEADFIVSSLINANVKNLKDETIGEVKDIVIRNNQVTGIVLSVGGFLGLGERYVVVDPSTINMTVRNGAWHIQTDASKESLESAPEFKYEGRWGR